MATYRLLLSAENELQSVRSVREGFKLLNKIIQQIEEMSAPTETLFNALAAGFNITKKGDGKRVAPISVKNVVVKPSANDLKDIGIHWASLDKLKAIHDDLNSTFLHWNANFGGVPGGPALLAALKKCKLLTTEKVGKAQSVLDKLSSRLMPKGLLHLGSLVEAALEKEVICEDIERRSIVIPHPDPKMKKTPHFFVYISLKNLHTKEDALYKNYQVVLSTLPTANGMKLFVNTLRDFTLPGRFNLGKEIDPPDFSSTGLQKVMNVVRMQLDVNDVFIQHRMAINPQEDVNHVDPSIQKIWIKNDFIWVQLKKSVKENQIAKINSEFSDALQAKLHVGRRKPLSVKRISTKNGIVLRYAIEGISPETLNYRMTQDKLQAIKQLLNLNENDMDAIRQGLKSK